MSFQIENDQTTNGFQTPASADNSTEANNMSQDDIASLVKRDANAQQHITNLEQERQEQRDAMAELQQQIARLEGTLSATDTVKDMLAGMQTGQQDTGTQAASAPSLDDIVAQATEKVTSEMNAKAQKELQDSNYQKIATALTSTYGDKANEHVTKIAEQNSMTFAEAQDMARNNPTLFSNLFMKKSDNSLGSAPSAGTTNTAASQSTGAVDAEYWNNMRRDKRSSFWTNVDLQKQYREWIIAQN